MQPQDDIDFWKWVIGLGAACLSGIAGGSWRAATKTENFETRLQSLEKFKSEQKQMCESQAKMISEQLCAALREMAKTEKIERMEKLEGIERNIAVIMNDNQYTKDHITEIFARLNKRRLSNPNDTGQRRRVTDFIED